MILSKDIFPIGKIIKAHGSKRELLFQCDSDILENDEINFIILDIEGIYVPFFIESIRLFTYDSGVLVLENVETENKRKRLIGCSLFLSKEYLHLNSNESTTTQQLIGFQLYSQEKLIGTIKEINDTTENPLFIVSTPNDELFIPIADEFFVAIDEEQQKIILDLPDGLLDIN